MRLESGGCTLTNPSYQTAPHKSLLVSAEFPVSAVIRNLSIDVQLASNFKQPVDVRVPILRRHVGPTQRDHLHRGLEPLMISMAERYVLRVHKMDGFEIRHAS